MTKHDLEAVISSVNYKDWQFIVEERPDWVKGFFVKAKFMGRCHQKGNHEWMTTRKWYISDYATKSEIVQTLFKCVLTAEEHEAREEFRYRGRTVFGPHFNVDMLVAMSNDEFKDVRRDLPTGYRNAE